MRVAWLLGLGLAARCVSERAGYAVAESAAPDRPTLRQAVEAYGNPAALRALPGGGLEGVWPGTATGGWAFEESVWGVRLLHLDWTATQGESLRLGVR